MTELSSDDIEQLRLFTLVCLEGYSQHAVALMLEAEELIARGMGLREQAQAHFARANQLALEYAQAKARPVPEEPIDW